MDVVIFIPKMAALETDGDFPYELLDRLPKFHQSLEEVETVLQPLFKTTVSENREKFQPLDRAKFDLVAAYALNSLFWMYLSKNGEDPREHDIKVELERIRGYMTKVKEVMDRAKQPHLNVAVAKRFLTSSLWTPLTDKNIDAGCTVNKETHDKESKNDIKKRRPKKPKTS